MVHGGIHAWTSTLNFRGNTIFTSNSAEKYGGGIVAMYSTLKFTGNTNFSSNIAVQNGGGIEVQYSNLKFNGDTAESEATQQDKVVEKLEQCTAT